jgi:hypothetical protein
MKHLAWDYRGYDDLNLGFKCGELQNDWNATLLGSINEAWGSPDESFNVFISKKFLPIIKSILFYNDETRSIGNKTFIPIEIETPKLYITKPYIKQFMAIDHGNYASVVIKNY